MKTTTPSRIIALASIALMLCAALTACGAQPRPVTSQDTSHIPTGELLYVVDGSASWDSTGAARQSIVAFHPGSAAASPLVSLPMGLTTQDHRRLYATTAVGGQTAISVYDTRSGARISSFVVAGTYSMDGRGYAGAVLSPDGRWLVLGQATPAAGTSAFALVDTQAHKLAQTIALAGDFDLDAISPGGTMLYLLQNLNDAAHHYYVRAYDLTARALLDTIIVDKTEINETKMTGTAVTRQMAPDGSIAYTLYIDPAHNRAFVHILPLGEASNDFLFARCIDLPAGASANLLHLYTLALSPDGTTLYATNAALGAVSAISLHGQDIFDNRVAATGHFVPTSNGAAQSDSARMLYNGAALSSDGQMLYVSGVRGIEAIRTSGLHVVSTYVARQTFTGVALSANGDSLYAADPASGITVIPLTSGGAPHQLQGPVQSPWGIAWVSA
jgi:DNA-binding beta-propeller fold protein YncE